MESGANILFVPRSRSVGQVVMGPVNSEWLHGIRGEYFVCTKVAQCWSGCYGPCELEMASWNRGRMFCLYKGRAVLVRLLWALGTRNGSWNQGRIFCLYQGRAVLVRLLWAL